MNKKILLSVSACVVAAILVLVALLGTPMAAHPVFGHVIALPLVVLALPMKLYVHFVIGEDGQWPSLIIFVAFLMLSGLMWGFIAERLTHIMKRKSA